MNFNLYNKKNGTTVFYISINRYEKGNNKKERSHHIDEIISDKTNGGRYSNRREIKKKNNEFCILYSIV